MSRYSRIPTILGRPENGGKPVSIGRKRPLNVERIDAFDPTAPEQSKYTPTALQSFQDWQRIPRPKAWRSPG
jgi:hypothetical protein